MSLNWREINAVLAELPLEGAFIQKIRQPDYASLVFELYQPGNPYLLLINMDRKNARICRIRYNLKKAKKPPRFAEFLRSRIRGGRIQSVKQIGRERILRMEISCGETKTLLWIRLWGGAPNVLATETDGRILEACFRRPSRGETAGEVYSPEQDIRSGGVREDRYTIREYPGEGDLNDRIAAFFRSRELEEEQENLRRQVRKHLKKREAGILRTLDKTSARLESFSQPEAFKEQGDLIMGQLHRIQPGDTRLETENWFRPGETLTIPLNPQLSPAENGQSYYKKYRKAKAGGERLQEEVQSLENTLREIRHRLEELPRVEDRDSLKAMMPESAGSSQKGPSGSGDDAPGLRFYSGPFLLLVGRNSRENDSLLRRYVRGNDWWLHARHYPGGYVFIKAIRGKTIPLETLLDAGNLALHFSKARPSGKAELFYTQVKYLRRAKDGPRGLVIPTQEKNLDITADPARLSRLLGDSSSP